MRRVNGPSGPAFGGENCPEALPVRGVEEPEALAPQPAATALALPAACYTQPEFAAIERGAVFGRSWQLVGHAAQVAAPGDHALAGIAGGRVVTSVSRLLPDAFDGRSLERA